MTIEREELRKDYLRLKKQTVKMTSYGVPKEIADICLDKKIPKNTLITIALCNLLKELADEESVSNIKRIIAGY